MSVRKTTQHDPLLAALVISLFVWIVFDSVTFGLIAGLIGYISVGKAQKRSGHKGSNR